MAYSVVTKLTCLEEKVMECHAPKQVSFCHNTVCHRSFSLLSPTGMLTLVLSLKFGKIFTKSVSNLSLILYSLSPESPDSKQCKHC